MAPTVQNNANPPPIRLNDDIGTNSDSASNSNGNTNAQKKRSRSPSAESTNHKKARDDSGKNERKEEKESTEGKRKSRIELKLEAAAPFNYFLTKAGVYIIYTVVGGVITLNDMPCKTCHYSWPG